MRMHMKVLISKVSLYAWVQLGVNIAHHAVSLPCNSVLGALQQGTAVGHVAITKHCSSSVQRFAH